MRAGCVWIEHFPLGVEGGSRADVRDGPVVLGGQPWERKAVLDCSPEAERSGVRVGMELRQAHQLCPEAVFLSARAGVYEETFDKLLETLDRFSPAVERVELGLAFMDIGGNEDEPLLARRIGETVEAETGFRPRTGLAGSRFAAEMAARRATPEEPLVIHVGRERRFLGSIEVGVLPLPAEVMERLELLGLKTLGQVAAFPPGALGEQFGPWGKQACDLARGIDPRPVLPRPKAEILHGEKWFDQPVLDREALTVAVAALLDSLLPGIQQRGLLCGMLELRISLERGGEKKFSCPLRDPSSSRERLLRRLRYRLTSLSLEGPVSGLGLWLRDLRGEKRKQGSLLSGKGKQPEPLRQAASRLREKLGHNPIQQVVAVDPSSLLPERRFALQDLDPL